MCFDAASGTPESSQNETSGCISITRSSTSASACTSRIFRPSANACWDRPLPVIVRAISFASANVRTSRAARGGVWKTLLARPPMNARAPASAAREPSPAGSIGMSTAMTRACEDSTSAKVAWVETSTSPLGSTATNTQPLR